MIKRVYWQGMIMLAVAAVVVAFAGRGASAQDEFEGWHLEPGVGQAHLVLVARVASIGQLTIVEGAKTNVALREYRFQPVRRLKGFFQRDQLSMTDADLGCPADDASLAPAVKEGEYRLLILAQQQGQAFGTFGCVSAAPGATTFEQRVPLLNGPDDPLVGVVETLIKVADSRSRRERATLVIDQLPNANGISAVPLLSSLKLRADLAAVDDRAYAPLARLAGDSSSAVRGGALDVLRDMLAAHVIPSDPKSLDAVALVLRTILSSDEANTGIRLAALDALGHLLELKTDIDWARDLLIGQLTTASTNAERAAAVTALSRIADPQAVSAVMKALTALPLDETPARELAYGRAARQCDAREAERLLIARLERSMAARQSLEAEVELLGQMKSKESVPLLLTAAAQSTLSPVDRHHVARALGRVGDDRAVPKLIQWMRDPDYELRELSLASLENLDSDFAAREARPLLKSEPNLPYKLRLARLLARHQLADGYELATEHLADAQQTASAALVLAALGDPRTTKDLNVILADKPDRHWRGAALTGLAVTGDEPARRQLREIIADDRNALVAVAAEAAGLTSDKELLLPLTALAKSRNRQIAFASSVALRRFFSGVRSSPRGLAAVYAVEGDANAPVVDIPPETRSAIIESVAALIADTYVDAKVRDEAFAVAQLLKGDRYAALLSQLADQAELEGKPMLATVQREMRRQRGAEE